MTDTVSQDKKIKGGYYLKARCIQDSDISKTAPHIREIWDWLLKEANHTDTSVCKRGQCIRSYSDIQEGLAWWAGWRKHTYSKAQCEISMKWLTAHTMITTMKTTRGLLVTICNYDFYQNPENYETHRSATTKPTRTPQTQDTINKNDKEWNEETTLAQNFDKFWREYPKKRDKVSALKAFRKYEPDEEDMIVLIKKIKEQSIKGGILDPKDNGQFIPYPATWLNKELWRE